MVKFFKYIAIAICILLIFIIGLTTLGIFSNIWFIDIFSHFKLHVILSALLISFFIGIYFKTQKIYSLFITINLFISITYFIYIIFFQGIDIFSYNNKNEGNGDIFYQNIQRLTKNEDIEKIYSNIIQNKVKYIAVVENSYEFNDFLESQGWFRIGGAKNTECGIYSKDKENYKTEIIDTESGYKICHTIIDEQIHLYVVHPHPPINGNQFNRWNLFMYELSLIKEENINNKLIIVGDFNNTIFNKKFRTYFSDIYIKSYYSRHSLKWYGSIISLPIDHVLSNMNNINFIPLNYNSSDHRGILINY